MHFLKRHDPSLYAHYRQFCDRDPRLVEVFEDLEAIGQELEACDLNEAHLTRLAAELTDELRRRLSKLGGARPRSTETRNNEP